MGNFTTLCGMLAGTLTTISFLPQLVKVWKSKSTKDISQGTFSLFCLGVALWLLYGILLHDGPIIMSNAVTLVLATSILALKTKYR